MGIFDFFSRGASKEIRRDPVFVRSKPVHRQRAFDGGADSRLLYSWITGNGSADRDIRGALNKMRARSRDLANNNDYVRGFFRTLENNVIGDKGIRLQARAKNARGELDRADNAVLERNFAAWSKRGSCSVDGQFSLASLARLALRTVARDGEVLVRKIRGREAGNKYNFALQILEADQLDLDYWATTRAGNEIRMGVEYNRFMRPVAYHLLRYHPGDDAIRNTRPDRERVPADQILHILRPDRIGQTRGVPWVFSAIARLKMLGGYEEAELVAARVSSAKMGFFETPDGEGGPVDDIDQDGNQIMNAEPGTFGRLAVGEKFTAFDPQHPTTAFDGFVKALLRGTSVGLGVSYHAFSNDLSGANYSSLRQGALEDRDNWKVLQAFMIEAFYQPIYDAWLEMVLGTGAIPLPMSRLEKYSEIEWQPRGWAWVDPLKEVNANKIAVDEGFKSRRRVVGETGQDFEQTADELAADAELLAEKGVKVGTPAKSASEEIEKDA